MFEGMDNFDFDGKPSKNSGCLLLILFGVVMLLIGLIIGLILT